MAAKFYGRIFVILFIELFFVILSECCVKKTVPEITAEEMVARSEYVLFGTVLEKMTDPRTPNLQTSYGIKFKVKCIYKGNPKTKPLNEAEIIIAGGGITDPTCYSMEVNVNDDYVLYLNQEMSNGKLSHIVPSYGAPTDVSKSDPFELTIVCEMIPYAPGECGHATIKWSTWVGFYSFVIQLYGSGIGRGKFLVPIASHPSVVLNYYGGTSSVLVLRNPESTPPLTFNSAGTAIVQNDDTECPATDPKDCVKYIFPTEPPKPTTIKVEKPVPMSTTPAPTTVDKTHVQGGDKQEQETKDNNNSATLILTSMFSLFICLLSAILIS